jgi:pantothenate kinase
LQTSDARKLVGIFGKPGVGKSTFTEFLSKNLREDLVNVVSMDGFHLSNDVLASLNLSSSKGAPNTFDVQGFATLLKRIRFNATEVIYYPIFDRKIEESIAAQGFVPPSAKLIFIEGNYLCHDGDGWEEIFSLFDETWYLEVAEELRIERLVKRHIEFGKSPSAAREWALGTDEKNAILIGENSHRADFVVHLD